jgi:hypothetical protein
MGEQLSLDYTEGTPMVEQMPIKEIAPNSIITNDTEQTMFNIMCNYMRNSDRNYVAQLLIVNKVDFNHLMIWLNANIPLDDLLFLDSQIKNKWSKKYFYEMAAFIHSGNEFYSVNYPMKVKL